jgi:predicted DNA-binding antitoxin AbrB/MazE fold protein
MSKILILGAQGSGKSTSIGNIPELKIEGLNPAETFIIGCTNKGLPFAGWMRLYPRAKVKLKPGTKQIIELAPTGNYYQTNDANNVAILVKLINETREEIKNIVIDDKNAA